MRKVSGLLVFLGLVAASLLWPPSASEPPVEESLTGSIVGRVTRHGYPVVARIEVRKVRDVSGNGCAAREFSHPFREIAKPLVGTGDPVGTTESDETGRFRIDGLPPAVYGVTAQTRDGSTGRWTLEVGSPGEVMRERLDIQPTGRTLLGRLRWSDGRPFAGQVSLEPFGTETGPDGRFVLTDLPRHAFPIQARVPGAFSRVVGHFDPDVDERINVVVDRGLVWREGRVVSADDGRSLGGITVGAFWREAPRRDGTSATATGPDGTFRVLSHPADPSFAAAGDEYLTEWVEDERPAAPLEIRLRRRPVVTGRVVTPAGRPVPGAHVLLFGLPTRGIGGVDLRWQTPVLADDEGRFRFTSDVTGFVMVAVYGGGFLSADLPTGLPQGYNVMAIDLSPGDRIDRELVAVPSPSVTGRVTNHTGNPVAGIRVHAGWDWGLPSTDQEIVKYFDELPSAVTGADGVYRFPTLPSWLAHGFAVYPPVGYVVESKPFRPVGTTTVDLDLPPPPARYLEVEVLSTDGERPVPGAWVQVEPAGHGDPDVPYWIASDTTTGPDGRARLGPLPPGRLVAGVSHPRFQPRWGIPVGGEVRARLALSIEPGAVLAGQVRMPDGSPAVAANVTIESNSAKTGPSGRFAFRNLRPGRHEVRASRGYPVSGYLSAVATVETGRENVVLTLEPVPGQRRFQPWRTGSVPTGRIAGIVLAPSGEPVLGAGVDVRPGNVTERFPPTWKGVRTTVWTGMDGRFAFEAIDDEVHAVRVVGPPHLFQRAVASASAGDESMVIRLAAAVQPVVTVLDASGQPLPWVAVELTTPGSGSRDRPFRLVTDARGRVRFVALNPESTLVLGVTPPDGREDLAETEIVDWAPADTTVRLRKLRTLRGVVRDRDGYPVGDASVWLSAADGAEREWEELHVGGDGRFEVEDAPSDRLEIRAGLPRRKLDAADLVTVSASPGPGPCEIEIDGGVWIGLHVPNWPADGEARVSLAWQGGVRRIDMPASGRIRFHGLPANKDFSLHAGPLPGSRMAFGDDLLPGTDHVIPALVGASISGRVTGPKKLDWFHISIYGKGIALRYDLPGDTRTDRYRIEGLPPGEYLFTILALSDGKSYKGEIRVKTGEPKDIELKFWR